RRSPAASAPDARSTPVRIGRAAATGPATGRSPTPTNPPGSRHPRTGGSWAGSSGTTLVGVHDQVGVDVDVPAGPGGGDFGVGVVVGELLGAGLGAYRDDVLEVDQPRGTGRGGQRRVFAPAAAGGDEAQASARWQDRRSRRHQVGQALGVGRLVWVQ